MHRIKIFDDYVLLRMNQLGLKSGISTYIEEAKKQIDNDVILTSEILAFSNNRLMYYLQLSLKLLFKKYEIVFPFGYCPLGVWKNVTLVIHDIRNFERKNENSLLKQFYWLTTWILVKKIKCSSNFTKNGVESYYASQKIETYYCPYNWKKVVKSDLRTGWLYIGHIEERKNVLALLQFFISNKTNLTLIGAIQTSNKKTLKLLESKFINYLGVVSDEEKIMLLKTHEFFINPSIYEGYSYTPLEAKNYGLKLFLSEIKVHKEVYNHSANYFNPELFNLSSSIESEEKNTEINYSKNFNEIFT